MSTRWQDGVRMVKACDEAGVRLFVVKQNRRNSTLQLLKRAVDEKRFGKINMGSRTFDLLKEHDGHFVSVNGATQIRAGVIRPEIVIPLKSDEVSGKNKDIDALVGTIAIDSIHTPVKNVKYFIEDYRVEQKTDYEKLIVDLETDGSIHPKDALQEAAKILIHHFMLFSDEKITLETEERSVTEEFDENSLHIRQLLKTKLIDLDLSVRALNCLKAADVESLGDLVQFNKNDLLKFRNFGKKSLTELEEIVISKETRRHKTPVQKAIQALNYYEIKNESRVPHPVIDYQSGSLRDDFMFGYLLFYRTDAIKQAVSTTIKDYQFAGLYNLRLKVSQEYSFVRIPEFLYTTIESDIRKSGAKQFDYVDPKNREVQVEMELAVTQHLKDIGAFLDTPGDNFKVEYVCDPQIKA